MTTASEALVCVYDAWNRLAKVYKDNGDTSGEYDANDDLIVTYSYDGSQRRIRKVVESDPDVTHDYYYNTGWRVLEVRKDSDTDPYEQYVWGIRYVHSPVCRFRDGNTDGDYDDEGDDTLYYTTDANFNVTALINTDGTVAERYVYDPYGKVTIYNSDWSQTVTWANSKKNAVLYTGHRFDDETGLFYCCYRYYHPTLGCWLQRDPLGYVDGMNLYQFARSVPTRLVDPEGTSTKGYAAEDYKIKQDGKWTKVTMEACCLNRDTAEQFCVRDITVLLMSYLGGAPAGSIVKDIALAGTGGVAIGVGIAFPSPASPVLIVGGAGLVLWGAIDAVITTRRVSKMTHAANKAVFYFCDCYVLDRKRWPRRKDRSPISAWTQ